MDLRKASLALIWMAGCNTCFDVASPRFSSAPSGLALDGDIVVVGSERRDSEGPSHGEISWVNPDDGSVITRGLSLLHSPRVAAGTRTVLAYGSTYDSYDERAVSELGAILFDGNNAATSYVQLSENAIRPRAEYDGTAYQVAWLEPKGDGYAIRGRSIDESGALTPVVDFPVSLLRAGGNIELRPFSANRVAMEAVEFDDYAYIARVHVWFATAGVADSPVVTVNVPLAFDPYCSDTGTHGLIGAETLPDADGEPVFRVFICSATQTPAIVVSEIAPAGLLRTAATRGFHRILGATSDRIIVSGDNGVVELLGDYSKPAPRFAGDVGAYPRWMKRGNDWVGVTRDSAMIVQRFIPDGGTISTTVATDDGETITEECHGPY